MNERKLRGAGVPEWFVLDPRFGVRPGPAVGVVFLPADLVDIEDVEAAAAAILDDYREQRTPG